MKCLVAGLNIYWKRIRKFKNSLFKKNIFKYHSDSTSEFRNVCYDHETVGSFGKGGPFQFLNHQTTHKKTQETIRTLNSFITETRT